MTSQQNLYIAFWMGTPFPITPLSVDAAVGNDPQLSSTPTAQRQLISIHRPSDRKTGPACLAPSRTLSLIGPDLIGMVTNAGTSPQCVKCTSCLQEAPRHRE